MQVCICGGGNLAHAFAGQITRNPHVSKVTVITRQPKNWGSSIDVYYFHKYHHTANLDLVTDKYTSLSQADIIILTMPAYARFEYIKKIRDFISPNAIIISAPSVGGINFILDDYLPQNRYICLQRVPYICRIIEYGKSVNVDVKSSVVAYFSNNSGFEERNKLDLLLNIEVSEIKSYYPLFLSNSNPILHIAGLCELIKKTEYDFIPPFYEIWNDDTSRLAHDMDMELGIIMNKLGVNEHRTLLEHYGVSTIEELTKKLKSIEVFKDVLSPMKNVDGKFVVDINSRYLTEDLPYGTCLIKLMGEFLGIQTRNIDFAIRQTQSFLNTEFVDSSGNLNYQDLEKILGFNCEIFMQNLEDYGIK